MTKKLLGTFLLLFSLATNAEFISLYTGFQKGSYNQIGYDIQKTCANTLKIEVEKSTGSLYNINQLIQEPIVKSGHRFAFVQRDALEVMNHTSLNRIVNEVARMFPEEITIVVNSKAGIREFSDLMGKKVASGQHASGIWFTSQALQQITGVKWLNIPRSPEEAILMVLVGELDAMIIVGPQPMRIFDELPEKYASIIDVIDIPYDEKLNLLFQPAILPINTYHWLKHEVRTYSTETVLVAANDVPQHVVKDLQQCLKQNHSNLKKFGHPKWRQMK